MSELRENKNFWRRHGECDGCGYCCEVIAHANVDFSGNDPDWIRARGIPSDGMLRNLPLINPCPQLSEEKRCKIYETRPKQCEDFPQRPQEIEMAPCVYWFENLVTGEKVGGTRSPYPAVTE